MVTVTKASSPAQTLRTIFKSDSAWLKLNSESLSSNFKENNHDDSFDNLELQAHDIYKPVSPVTSAQTRIMHMDNHEFAIMN